MPLSKIQVGLRDDLSIPQKSLGLLFYNKLKQSNPNKIIMIDSASNETFTCEQILKLSLKLSVGLKNIGVKKGDVITIISENNWKIVISILAGFYIGAPINLLNPDYTTGELKRLLSVVKPILILCTEKSLKHIIGLENELYFPSHIFLYNGKSVNGIKTFDDLLANLDEAMPIEQNTTDVALILTSSGTTGFPKLVQLTHANIRILQVFGLDPLQMDINKNETLILHLPLFHIFGAAITLQCVFANAKFIILEKFIPDRFLQIIQGYKVSKLVTVPPVLLFLLKSPLVDKYDCSSIRDVICGAAVLKKEVVKMVEAKLKIEAIRQVYGCTEVTGGASLTRKDGRKKYGSVGKPTSTHEIKVCKPDTNDILGPHQVGELLVKGGGTMKGYLGNEAESENAFDSEGFFKTGDLGYFDEDGCFFIVDRLKEVIKYKGFQVSPTELESLLLQHQGVKDAGVVGMPDAKSGEVPVAFIVKQPERNVTAEELISFVEENISVQKRLYGGVRFIDEIPKNASGKILRRRLKELI